MESEVVSSFDRSAILIRANREKKAAERAACIEAKVVHRRLSELYYELAAEDPAASLGPVDKLISPEARSGDVY